MLLVEPNQHPRPVEIGTELEDLQNAVGGYIEVVYPFDEPVGLVMNEEGKLDGLPLNRALRDDNGEIYDVVAGSFLVVGLTDEDFGSLSPDQMKAFEEKFHSPEVFVRMGRGIMAVPLPDEKVEKPQDKKLDTALMVASSREERKEEVMTDAGGSRKQDSESGDQHVEAERTYHSLSCQSLPEPQEECEGKEGA